MLMRALPEHQQSTGTANSRDFSDPAAADAYETMGSKSSLLSSRTTLDIARGILHVTVLAVLTHVVVVRATLTRVYVRLVVLLILPI